MEDDRIVVEGMIFAPDITPHRQPAILAFASRTAPTDRPDVGYAMIFPSMTVLKILFVQIAAVLLGG
jgi:uncharacterized transporter YbjL